MPSPLELTLRERKKQRTRQAISDAATRLFAERGFDAVTTDDVAAAAEVSKKTVFNYFHCKEDLLFDEADAAEARLLAAVRERAPGTSIVDAMRANSLATITRMCAGEQPWIETMTRLVAESPALQARMAQIYDRVARSLAEVIREEMGARPADARPYAAAQALVGVQRAVLLSARRRLESGQRGRTLADGLRSEAKRAYALLEDGLAGLGVR